MKKYLATMMLSGLFMLGACAQDLKTADVPANIKSACLQKFPETAKAKVSWEKEKGNFEANWGGKSGEDNSAMFTPAGNFIEIVKAISVSQLPASILAYVKEHEHGARIKEAGMVTDAKGTITYEAEIKGKELIFDKAGKFLKAE
ncbi:MAG: PepSY-like domain-containing protein [Ferruginibacter sp.]